MASGNTPRAGLAVGRGGLEGYTAVMDAVRFGRALGTGARQAVKTLVTAVDAATAENPAAKRGAATQVRPTPAGSPRQAEAASLPPSQSGTQASIQSAAKTAGRTLSGARSTQRGLLRGSKRFGEALWGPFVRLSGVLWLEVSGVFFGLFAVFAGLGAWRLREAWRLTASNAPAHRGFESAAAMLAVFGYFCATSFLRARRRERRR
jgi:hypothetical protein